MLRLARFIFPLLIVSLTALAGDNAPAPKPSVLKLTLETAIQAALAKNFAIQVEKFEPKIAQENITQQLGHFDPTFSLTAQRTENALPGLFQNDIHLRTRALTRTDLLSADLAGATSIGLTYDLGLSSSNTLGIFNHFTNFYESTASVSIKQPLLRGFGTAANLAQVRIARNNAKVTEWQLRQQIIDTITTTNFVYNELHFAKENLQVAEQNQELANQLLKDNQAREKIGTMALLDVAEARAQVASREEAVILARRTILDNENLLKQLVTNDIERLLDVRIEIEPPPSPPFHADVRAAIREALELRPDYRQAILTIERSNITLAFTRNEVLPRFDLTASLALLGIDNEIGRSLSRIGDKDQTLWTAGAIMSLPIPNREARGARNAAALECAKALVALKQLEQQVVVDVDNASGQIVTSGERITSTSEATRLARETLDAADKKLKAGTGTTFEVLDLQEKLAEAEAAELRARADYNKAVSEYQRQTGTALKVHNVVFFK
ncbi:outer membrane protein TolC [Chthoniobacter flavus]|nr:TolC family protein [Chthoniobacter flavus]TCO89340.1 outer membrane protein TolC [Chthoniobacter flavus]